MAVVQSSIHANLNRDKILSDTWWIYYCCCGGTGIGPFSDPLVGSDVKELCLRSACACDPNPGGELGFIHNMSVFCCITEHCQIPPMANTPKCIMCATGSKKGNSLSYKNALFDYGQIFNETFWLYYVFCFGCGVSKPGAGRPYLAMQEKFLFVTQTVALVPPVEDGVMCSGVGTECCLWMQCQMPPAPNAPKFKLCGKVKAGSGGNGAAIPGSGGNGAAIPPKPTQVEMA